MARGKQLETEVRVGLAAEVAFNPEHDENQWRKRIPGKAAREEPWVWNRTEVGTESSSGAALGE